MACWVPRNRHHTDRVKKLVTEPLNPWVIISAAEDSTGGEPRAPVLPLHSMSCKGLCG